MSEEKTEEKSKYLSMSSEIDEFSYAFGAKEKLKSGAKIFGKGLLNVGIFTATEVVPGIFKQMQKNAEEVRKKRDSESS